MDRIRSAFIGLVVLLASWLILNTINPDLTTFYAVNEGISSEDLGSCDVDSDCGDKEKCSEEGFCITDLTSSISGTPCVSITIQGYDITADDCQNISTINENGKISFSVYPLKEEGENKIGCLGYLEVYPDPDCQGDKQMVVIDGQSKNNTYSNETSERIRSVKYKELETY
jgi:hypothetical protein